MKKRFLLFVLLIGLLFSGCAPRPYTPDYSSHTDPNEDRYKTMFADLAPLKSGEPAFALNEPYHTYLWTHRGFEPYDVYGYDLRNADASAFDFSVVSDFNNIAFSSTTVWPDTLPKGIDPDYILKLNMNPGLGVKSIHEQGITGEGVSIAIVDQALLMEHEQYKTNLMLYEKIHGVEEYAQMHGGAVASIAVGKDIGVAPDAELYFIASSFGHFVDGKLDFDAAVIGDCILRILYINKQLPKERKIRVISISKDYSESDKGYQELTEAIRKADKAGVLIITASLKEYYGITILGSGRDYTADPDDYNSYIPSSYYADRFYEEPELFSDVLFAPMASRTVAACYGTDQYEIVNKGGMSWVCPWLAGLYALCCQVKPNVTPTEFFSAVKETAITTEHTRDGVVYQLNIVDPAGAIRLVDGD